MGRLLVTYGCVLVVLLNTSLCSECRMVDTVVLGHVISPQHVHKQRPEQSRAKGLNRPSCRSKIPAHCKQAQRRIHLVGEMKSGTTFLEVLMSNLLHEACDSLDPEDCCYQYHVSERYTVAAIRTRPVGRISTVCFQLGDTADNASDTGLKIPAHKHLIPAIATPGGAPFIKVGGQGLSFLWENCLKVGRAPDDPACVPTGWISPISPKYKEDMYLLIVRDPRECAISYAHFLKIENAPYRLSDLHMFDITAWISFRWAWFMQRPDLAQNTFAVFYDDLTKPGQELKMDRALMDTVIMPANRNFPLVDDAALRRARANSTPEAMRKAEEDHSLPGYNKPGLSTSKVRNAQSGKWMEEMHEDVAALSVNLLSCLLPPFLANKYVGPDWREHDRNCHSTYKTFGVHK
mmetsp:Transcript_12358/g.40650  ORF Transcript_12358/g.40650 Transcript_12358/m.40650 type:complete len:405 (+) Transcript_12358:86-1300(+)